MGENEILKKSVQINKLINTKNFNEALSIIETVFDEDLTDLELANSYNQKAICLLNLKQFDDALLYFEKSWTLDEYYLNHTLYDAAFQKVHKKNYNKAYWLFKFIRYSENNDEKNSLKYYKLFLKNNLDLDEEEISTFTGINVKNDIKKSLSKDKYIKLADECLSQGNTKEAIEYLDKISNDKLILSRKADLIMDYAISQRNLIYEDYFGFWRMMHFLNEAIKVNKGALLIKAYYLFDAGYLDLSKKYYDDYLKRRRNDQRAVSGKICVLNELGEFDEAIELVKRLPIKNKKIFQSEILIAKGDYKEANKLINSILKKNKKNVQALLRKAILDMSHLNFEKALKSLDKILKLSPYQLDARLMKSEILGGLHRNNEAIKILQQIKTDNLKGYKDYKKYLRKKDIKNSGFYGVFEISSDEYNWEYVYVESDIFKRLKSYYFDDLKAEVEKRGLAWKIIDNDLAEKTISKNNKLLENSDSDDETTNQDPSGENDSTRGVRMKRFKHIGRISDVKIEDSENNTTLVGLEIIDKMNELSEENQKLKEDAKEHGWMVGQFDIRLGRLYKENQNLKQLIVRGADKHEYAEDILRIAEKLELIKKR
ncbi:MAG: hypothetical protein IKH29_02465 [Methanobrevibacter sp.]|uniref:tetratricopeptide repeat protein n=1 Tax=Methanobrevibacter sp. TaxID=66852 RepID=UPI0025D4EB5E|nr:tetratricopeptide repeat protein [Methanobrevibacter sp.]MBR3112561.1 hypothetical protein [Methanobrevibacter sp.]